MLNSEELFQTGKDYLDQEEYLLAYEQFQQLVELEPNSHQAWNNQGFALLSLGEYEEAIKSYDKALENEPNNYIAWNQRGFALHNLGQYEQAIKSYDKALEIKPNYHEAWNRRGIILCDNFGRYKEALTSFDQAIEFKSDDYTAWVNRGIALSNLGYYKEAMNSYDKALKIKPNYYKTWNSRGALLCDKLGRYEEAIACFDKAIQFQADDYYLWVNKGIALKKLGRYEEAINSLDKALDIKPNSSYIWKIRGDALEILGRYEEAINSLDKALDIKPDYYVVWNKRGIILCDYLGRYEEAIHSFDKAIDIKPDYHIAWGNRGIAAVKSRGYVPFLHTQQRKPELNKRGYEGELASYRAGLEIIHQETHPEGWGYLHHEIGKAHYFRGRQKAYSGLKSSWDYWRQAENSYKTALLTLKPPEFLELYLEVLKDLIRVLLNLKEIQEAQELQRQGTDVLRRILEDSKQTENSKAKLTRKLANFSQSTVDMVVESGYLAEALTLAEAGKNICLRWLLGIVEIPEIEYSQIQTFLNSTTAAVYWHLSPAALTTFIIKSDNCAPILISHPIANSQLSEAAQRLIEFE